MRRPQRRKHNPADRQHRNAARRVRRLPSNPPEQRAEQRRPRRSADLAPAPQLAQDHTSLALPGLEAAQAVQACHDGGAGHGQEAPGGVEAGDGRDAREQKEGHRAGEHADADGQERRQAAHDGALQEGGDEAHEREETAIEGRGAAGRVVRVERGREEGEGEFQAGEGQQKEQVSDVE